MGSAFVRQVLRSIRGSLGRFLAIVGIVALGCGFFAGLLMCGPDMRQSADAFYDGCDLYDLRLISTSGFEDADVERVRSTEGVAQAEGAKTLDAMASLGNQQVAVRITSMNMDVAAASQTMSDSQVASDDDSYLNRPVLKTGRWPQANNECVISADKLVGDVGVGDTVTMVSASKDLGELTTTTTFTVVGLVSSPEYPYTGSFGSTSLGSGSIEQYLYVREDAFQDSVPYTQIYLTVNGATAYQSGSDEYQDFVGQVKQRLEEEAPQLANARLEDLRSLAQQKIDQSKDELQTNRDEAQSKLADAKAQLDNARLQIQDGQAQYDAGVAQYEDGVASYQQGRIEALRKIAQGQATLDSGSQTLAASLAKLQSGEKDYAAGIATYDEGVSELCGKLGANSLEEASQALDANEAQVEALRQKTGESVASLRSAQATLDESVDAASRKLDATKAELKQKESELTQAKEQLDSAEAALLEALAAQGISAQDAPGASDALAQAIGAAQAAGAPQEQLEALQTAKDQADAIVAGREKLGDVDAALKQIETGRAQVTAAREQLELQREDGQKKIDDGTQQLLTQLTQAGVQASSLDDAETAVAAWVSSAEDQIAQARSGIAQLEQAREQLAQSRTQLDEGWQAYNQGVTEWELGQRELDEQTSIALELLDQTAQQLEQARQTLQSSLQTLEDSKAAYEQGVRDYEESASQVKAQLDDAQAQIDDAQRQVDELEAPSIYVLDRTQSEGIAAYDADSRRMDNIASVFPLVFFLVAALVALTTMTRMVEDDRVLIGTFKALGYSSGKIAAKYLWYALLAGALGAVAGIAILCQVLPLIVTSAYSVIYPVPLLGLPMPVNPVIALMAGGLGVGVTLLATWGAVMSSLRESPATLMLPRAPRPGKRILLERVGFVWHRLSFSWKVTCRNLFRYKRRMAMTVIGIAGCTALLLTGFGLHDSIWDIIDAQFGPIVHYDTTIGLSSSSSDDDVRAVESYLRDSDQVSSLVRVQTTNMQAGSDGYDGTLRLSVVVPRSSDELAQAITLRERTMHGQVAFDQDSVVLAEKTASLLGVGVGDTIRLYTQDDIGNATGDGVELTVTGICENYVGNVVYVGSHAWRAVDGRTPRFLTLLATTSSDSSFYEQAADDLHQMDGVSTVAFTNETIQMYEDTLSVVNMVVVVLIVSAAALAAIVLFNLTNINISERVREIATLKVLGFTQREVYSYVFREVLLLAFLGDLVGLGLGVLLEGFVVRAAEVDCVMFGRTIHPASFAISLALTMAFAVVIVLLMRPKLDRVDMVESLKSVD